MENYNIQIVFQEDEQVTQRIIKLMTEEEPDLRDMLTNVSIVSECSSECAWLFANEVARLTSSVDLPQLHKTLQRDFLLSMPRIAAIRKLNVAEADSRENRYFGPYTQEMLFDQQHTHESFDLVIAENDQQALSLLEERSDSPITGVLLDESRIVIEASVYGNDDEMNCESLRQAIFMGIDIARNRDHYDYAHRRPLQKLYHDRPDNAERPRFAPFVPKTPAPKA